MDITKIGVLFVAFHEMAMRLKIEHGINLTFVCDEYPPTLPPNVLRFGFDLKNIPPGSLSPVGLPKNAWCELPIHIHVSDECDIRISGIDDGLITSFSGGEIEERLRALGDFITVTLKKHVGLLPDPDKTQ